MAAMAFGQETMAVLAAQLEPAALMVAIGTLLIGIGLTLLRVGATRKSP